MAVKEGTKKIRKAPQFAGNNSELFKGLYYVKAKNTKTGDETGWCTRIQLVKALGGGYGDTEHLFAGVGLVFRKVCDTRKFKGSTYSFEFNVLR